jgi:hypothetical protein
MGDAGSTVLGYIFAVMPLLVIVEAKPARHAERFLMAAVLVVWPFLADGTFTILRRLRKRENIFKAHRSHLYQRLVIAGRSHREVTLVYGALAVVGGGLAWCVVTDVPFGFRLPLELFRCYSSRSGGGSEGRKAGGPEGQRARRPEGGRAGRPEGQWWSCRGGE